MCVCVCVVLLQASGARSNSVILVKNLPSGVEGSELEALFSPFGSLGRVLLPSSGLTAIIEFLEPTEAKKAFTRLAYSKVSMCVFEWVCQNEAVMKYTSKSNISN